MGTKLGPDWDQTSAKLGSFGGPLEVPWGLLGAPWEDPWGTPGVPGTDPAPGTQKVPKVCNRRQKHAQGLWCRHGATPDFGTPIGDSLKYPTRTLIPNEC